MKNNYRSSQNSLQTTGLLSSRFAVTWVSPRIGNPLRSPTKLRPQRLLLAGIVSLAVLLLLLRLFVFVSGHGRRRFQGATTDPSAATVHVASYDTSPAGRRLFSQPWTDRFADGTPDFFRLTDPADQAAFRQWFTAIANYQAIRPRADVPSEIIDCASLLRYAYREALKRHDDTWFASTGIEISALPGEIRAWRYPETPLGAALFRVRPGSFESADTSNGAFAQFADAKTLVERNAYLVSRDVREAQPGDLLFYRQFGQSSPWHSMIVTRIGGLAAVVYDTGEDHGKAGELRRVALAELLDHPQPQWRPLAANPNFLGVYRWNILRGAQ
jgi:uncharacterized protein YfaT (DUF1175 family)